MSNFAFLQAEWPAVHKAALGETVFAKARMVIKAGSDAVNSRRAVLPADALDAIRELFQVSYWLAHTIT